MNIRTYTGALSAKDKRELQDKITDLMVQYEGKGNPDFRNLAWMMLEEEAPENWILGGNDLKDLLMANKTCKESYLRNRNEKDSQ